MEATATATNSKIRRLQSAGIPRSPRLSRSSSGRTNSTLAENHAIRPVSPQQSQNRSSSVSLPEIQALALSRPASPQVPVTRTTRSATTSPRPSIHRSRSTAKSRGATPTRKERVDEQNYSSIPISRTLGGSPQRRLSFESRGDQKTNFVRQTNLAKLFRSSSQNVMNAKGGDRALPGSPSAWALSPNRQLPLAPDSPKVKAVSGVLKLFNKQKKVSSAQEEEYHQYKIMCSRLVQWRFVNAKAEVASAKVKKKAQGKLFGVWLKLYKMRYAIAEKRMKVERLEQKVKLLEIVCPQIELLNEWEKLEKKNCEGVGRVTRKLSAYSTKLPLVNGAMAELVSLFDAMKLALEVVDNIEDTILNFHFEAEKVCKLLRELIVMVEMNMECFTMLEKEIASMISLEAHEESLVVHLIQANTKAEAEAEAEAEDAKRNCKLHLMKSFKNKQQLSSIYSMLNVS